MDSDGTQASKQQVIQACMQDLRRIVKALESYSVNVEKRFGLTGPQLWALWELGQISPCPLKDLAGKMRLDPSTVVGVVSRLTAKGLVERRPDLADGRRVSLVLTNKGQGIVATAPHPAQGHLLAGLDRLDQQKVEVLRETLDTLVQVLEAGNLEAPFFFARE